MKKTIILALTFLFLFSTVEMASAADFSLTIKALGIRPSIEAGMYLGDNLETTVGFDYDGEHNFYIRDTIIESGYVVEVSPGLRYYYKQSGKVDSFFLGRLTMLFYGSNWSSFWDSEFLFTGGLGFTYNIDPRFAVITEGGLLWQNGKVSDWSYNTITTFYAAGFKCLF